MRKINCIQPLTKNNVNDNFETKQYTYVLTYTRNLSVPIWIVLWQTNLFVDSNYSIPIFNIFHRLQYCCKMLKKKLTTS